MDVNPYFTPKQLRSKYIDKGVQITATIFGPALSEWDRINEFTNGKAVISNTQL